MLTRYSHVTPIKVGREGADEEECGDGEGSEVEGAPLGHSRVEIY